MISDIQQKANEENAQLDYNYMKCHNEGKNYF